MEGQREPHEGWYRQYPLHVFASDFRNGWLELSHRPIDVRARARVTEPTLEREDDDIEAISRYENVKTINLYVKPAEGAIEQLYSASVQPVNINVTNSVVTIIGADREQNVEKQFT